MSSPRTLGFASALTQANEIDVCQFVKVIGSGAIGTRRYHNRRATFDGNVLTEDITASVDGGSQTWTAADFIVGPISQSDNDPLSVSWMDFANIDYVWTEWAKSPGLRGAQVYIYKGWFSGGSLSGSYELFRGEIDNQEHGDRSRMALKPFGLLWERSAPWQTLSMIDSMFAKLMPDPSKPIIWGDERTENRDSAGYLR